MKVEDTETIGAVKAKIQDLVDVAATDLPRFIFAGFDGEPEDSRTLSDYNMVDNAKIKIIARTFEFKTIDLSRE